MLIAMRDQVKPKAKHPKAYSKILIAFAVIFLLIFKLQAQTPEADSLQQLLNEHTREDSIRVNFLNELADKLKYKDVEKALNCAKESNDISYQIDYEKGKARSYVLIGVCYDEKSDYQEALISFNKALKVYEKLNDKNGYSSCYNNIGIIYERLGDYSKALDYYQKALIINEDLGNKKGLSSCYNNIGIIYFYEGDYEKALEYYQKSLEIIQDLGSKQRLSYQYNNLGLIYRRLEDYPKALEYYQKSVKIKEEHALIGRLGTGYFNIGNIYQLQGEYEKAYEYYNKSLEISLRTGRRSSEIHSYIGLASLYLKQGNAKDANNWSKKAYLLAKETGEPELIKESSELLAESSYILGKFKDAYNYHVIFKNMNDSLFNEEEIKKITGLEYQYKYEKEKREAELAQQQIELIQIEKENRQKLLRNSLIAGSLLMFLIILTVFYSLMQKRKANRVLALQREKLRERNAELSRLNKEIASQSKEIRATNHMLKELNATKDKFFSIIAHDLKAPFNALLGWSEILLEMHKEYDDQKREQIIKTINKSIVGAYKLLENLLTWSFSQSGRMPFSPQKLNLNEALDETIIDLRESAHKKNIKINNTIPDDEVVTADKNMIATVMRNLISNAIKFTNSNQQITLSIKKQKDGKFHEISVADTGLGIPKEKIDDLFRIDKNTSTNGTDNEKGTGLGLILCKEFVEKHGGKIWVASELNVGTTFSFSLPVS